MALACGVAHSVAAALEKRESVAVGGAGRGLRLLVVLVRRRWWLLAMALSVVGWATEAAALALAPIPVVTTLRGAGRGVLVVVGRRWLDESFGGVELAGVGLLAGGGILAALGAASGGPVAGPLSNLAELAVGAAVVVPALLAWRARHGLLTAAVAGLLFAATGVYTKEIGDRVARHGLAGILPLAATPGPWLMVAMSVWAISLLQSAFRYANAASVAAANATVSSAGLIVAGVILYRQPVASGAFGATLLSVGVVVATLGVVALAFGGTPVTGPLPVDPPPVDPPPVDPGQPPVDPDR